jgi:uncharacterized protein
VIVVSDTSPLTALITVAEERILPALFGEVIVPEEVFHELQRGHEVLPSFLVVRAVQNRRLAESLTRELDRGEAEAIALAGELNADLLLMDEKAGRKLARREGIKVIGLMGVLLMAKQRGLITSVRVLIDALRSTAGFRVADTVVQAVLREADEL